MSKQASLTSSMAKMFESHLDMPGNSGKGGNRLTTVGGNNFTAMDKKLNLLNEKVDKILNFQEDVMEKLGSVHQGIDGIGKGMDKLRTLPQHLEPQGAKSDQRFIDSVYHSQLQAICSEILRLIKSVHQEASKQRESLEGVENVLSSMDKVVKFVAETFKNSRIVDFILKGIVPWKKEAPAELPHETKEKPEEKGAKSKHVLSSSRGVQAEIRGAVEDSKTGKKSDDNNGKCDKTKGFGSPVPNVNCRPPEEQRSLATQTIGYSDKSSSSEIDQKDEHTSTRVLNINESPEKQDPAKNHECARDASHLAAATTPQKVWLGDSNACKHVHVTSGDTGRVTPASSYTASEIFQAASRPTTLCPSISCNLQKVDVRETITVTKEQPTRGPAEKGVKEQSASLVSTESEGKGLLPAKFKNTQSPHQDTRTDFGKEVKTAKLESKPDTQATADRNSQMRFHKSSIESKPKEVTVTVCKKGSDTREKECRKDEVTMAKSCTGTLPPSQQLDSDTKGRKTEPDALRIQNMDPDSGQCRDTAKDNERADDTHTASGAQEAHVIDDSPPPPAPFEHRIVIIKQAAITASYSVCQDHVLGGGRFGQVHRCAETSSGLTLAAKIIKVKSAKDREEVKNEINIMNQLNHANLIQLYDAFECKNSFTLIMEYVDGGELFDRLSDENYSLTELDAILFAKQICEGVYYLHQQYILHLDLKPENILCVSHTGNQIKIIDFGLARRYKPREKLKVNFGTPEFLAPEVVNYDFVSFPTDMWSVGVITYMLLSGLSPFLGDNDTETMNYIVNCNWDFNAEAFEQVSEDAKDFISQLLVKEKSCRKSAAQCLKHEWLNNLPAKAKKSKVRLKSQVQLQRYLVQRNWKKHFYVVAAANRLRKLQQMAMQTA